MFILTDKQVKKLKISLILIILCFLIISLTTGYIIGKTNEQNRYIEIIKSYADTNTGFTINNDKVYIINSISIEEYTYLKTYGILNVSIK